MQMFTIVSFLYVYNPVLAPGTMPILANVWTAQTLVQRC